jgi:hypothetical protein
MFIGGFGPHRNDEFRVTFFWFRGFGQVFGVNRFFSKRIDGFFGFGIIHYRIGYPTSRILYK